MLTLLHIENVAVIERADVEFEAGLNVLTGETGAGKSIVIDSLEAVLGGRVSRDLVRTGSGRALITAVFEARHTSGWCEENGILPSEDGLILQRTISAEGKSSCRINGTPVSALQMRELGSMLIDIHGQNDGLKLMDESRHRAYLDEFGVPADMLEKYRESYQKLREISEEIGRLTMDEIDKERLTETLRYQIYELEEAKLRTGEYDELSAKRELLKNAGRLAECLDEAYEALYAGEWSAAGLAAQAEGQIERSTQYSEELEAARKAVSEARFLLEDAAERVRDFRKCLDFSPKEYDYIEGRLALIRSLCKKYKRNEDELLRRLEECRRKLEEIEFAGDKLIMLERRFGARRQDTEKAAEDLRISRLEAAKNLEERIISELRELNMPSVRFQVIIKQIPKVEDYGPHGGDEVYFLMSANAGEQPGRISRIASGGELSRIMLAMKNVFAENDSAPTMVFDEIDAGVSGIAAQRVGEKLGRLSRNKQVLCVTHLPQIAAMADKHFAIEKTERDGRAYTTVAELDGQGRKEELARLHGGEHITQNTLISAQEQLRAADEFKKTVLACKNNI